MKREHELVKLLHDTAVNYYGGPGEKVSASEILIAGATLCVAYLNSIEDPAGRKRLKRKALDIIIRSVD